MHYVRAFGLTNKHIDRDGNYGLNPKVVFQLLSNYFCCFKEVIFANSHSSYSLRKRAPRFPAQVGKTLLFHTIPWHQPVDQQEIPHTPTA